MSKIDDRIIEIKTLKIGATNKRVLLVEGIDDVDGISIFLNNKFPGWDQKWEVVSAGNKRQVLEIIKKETGWIGLVDCDEWTLAERVANQQLCGNLEVLPRFCFESYIVDPDELWQAFPQKQQAKIAGGLPALKAEFIQAKPLWLRHAALWHVVNPLWGKLRALGFKEGLLDPADVPDDAALILKLQEWHDAIDANVVMQEINNQISYLQTIPDPDFYRQKLYAKKYFPMVVQDVLNRLLGNMDSKARRLAIIRHLPVPQDLDPLWIKMGLM